MAETIGIKSVDSFDTMLARTRGSDTTLPYSAKGLEQPNFSEALQQSIGSQQGVAPESASIEPPVESFESKPEDDLKAAFQNFVGQTLFSQMISSLRSSQEGSAYFNGGRAEKIFQGQLDQILSEEMTKASASQLAEPMYDLFQLQRTK